MVELRCDMLVRVDFVAGSDLLNWVVAQRQDGSVGLIKGDWLKRTFTFGQ